MSESRPNLPAATGRPSPPSSGQTRKAARPGFLARIIPTMGRIMGGGLSGAVSRLAGFEQQRVESRKQELLEGTGTGLDASTALVADQNEVLEDIIETIKRIRLEPQGGGIPDIDLDRIKRGRGPKGQRGRARAVKPGAAPKPTGRVPQIPPDREGKARRAPSQAEPENVTPRPAPEPERVTPRATQPEAERVGERSVSGRTVRYNEAAYNRTLTGIRVVGGVAVVIGAMGIAQQVRELYALRQLNQENSNEGITEQEFQRELSNIAGSVLGGVSGAYLGAKVGGLIGGVAGGPWGALAGGVAGGIFGGLTGESAGELIGAAIFDQLTGSNTFEELWNRKQDEARRNLAAGASTLGAEPETDAERVVQERQAREEQRQRQLAGIEQPFENPELEALVRSLQTSRRNLAANPSNRRLQRTVTNQENSLQNLLNSPRFRASDSDRQRALRFLRGETEPVAELASPTSMVSMVEQTDLVQPTANGRQLDSSEAREEYLQGVQNLLRDLSGIEFNEIKIESEQIEFDGSVKAEYQVDQDLATRVSAPAGVVRTAPEMEVIGSISSMLGGAVGANIPAPSMDLFSAMGGAGEPRVQRQPATAGRATAPMPQPVGPSISGLSVPEVTEAPQVAPEPPSAPAPAPQEAAAAPVGREPAGGGDFMSEVNRVSARFGINPTDLLAVMRSESSLNPRAVNPTTGASGLIQFMPRTAASLGTSVEAIRQMSAVEQMRYVERYFESVGVRPGSSAGRLYAYVFLPGRAGREVLTAAGENFYEANRGLDVDRDGRITIADLDVRLARFGSGTAAATAQAQQAATDTGARVAEESGQQVISDRDRTRRAAEAANRNRTQMGRLAENQDAGSSANRVTRPESAEVPLVKRLQRAAA